MVESAKRKVYALDWFDEGLAMAMMGDEAGRIENSRDARAN